MYRRRETQCLVILLVSGAVLLVSGAIRVAVLAARRSVRVGSAAAAELTLLVSATQYARVTAVSVKGE